MGLSYWWSLDFASTLSLTCQHNYYVLVMIKHVSKWLELVPLLDHSSERTAYAFMDKMFSRFGVPGEVLANKCTQFQNDFQDLCEKALIDHWTILQYHLQVDKLVEQMV